MSQPLRPAALSAVVEPLLPPELPKPKGGRPRIGDRAALTGILFVLRSGLPREMLPREMGCSSGTTCWPRLRAWQQAGVWDRLQRLLLDRLGTRKAIDFGGAALDSAAVAAKSGAGRRARTQRIGARRAPSATASRTPTASRSP
jgi:transposase